MQNFMNIRFPTNISFGSVGGPQYLTNVIENQFGVENRQVVLDESRHVYNVSNGIQDQSQINEIASLFHNCMGRAIAFRFKDWNDYKITNQTIATADGKTLNFQIYKEYRFADKVVRRKITKPVSGTLKVHNLEDGLTYSCDYNLGIITFSNPVKEGEKIIISAEFDTPVRFDSDMLETRIISKDLREVEQIRLVEVKV